MHLSDCCNLFVIAMPCALPWHLPWFTPNRYKSLIIDVHAIQELVAIEITFTKRQPVWTTAKPGIPSPPSPPLSPTKDCHPLPMHRDPQNHLAICKFMFPATFKGSPVRVVKTSTKMRIIGFVSSHVKAHREEANNANKRAKSLRQFTAKSRT